MEFFSLIGAAAGKVVPEAAKEFFRRRKLADDEIADLRKQLLELDQAIADASVEAQLAVRGSPNDPNTQVAHEKAVRKATVAGQQFANLCGPHNLANGLPVRLLAARNRFRDSTTEDHNLDLIDGDERQLRCADIEAATAEFHQCLRDYAHRELGVGFGAKSGRIRGRGTRG